MALRQQSRGERLSEIMRRDGSQCVWCGNVLEEGSVLATLEHVIPRLKGGPSWIENEALACRNCNNERGHTAPAEWLRCCFERGKAPALEVIRMRLLALEDAIRSRGGLRKVRPYLAGQIRRMSLWFPCQ